MALKKHRMPYVVIWADTQKMTAKLVVIVGTIEIADEGEVPVIHLWQEESKTIAKD